MRKWLTRATVPAALASTALVFGALPAAPAHESDLTTLHAVLTGDQEVPGPGDEDGRGAFAAVVKGDRLCYVLVATRIETAAAAHIHPGRVNEAGGVIVGLTAPNKVSADCLTAVPDEEDTGPLLSESDLAAIVDDPAAFYVNVHNARFGAGAIRGQLR